MTAPGLAAAVQIAADALPAYPARTADGVPIVARQVVAALARKFEFHPPGTAERLAALEKVAEAALDAAKARSD